MSKRIQFDYGQIPDTTWACLAGWVEGEGSISILSSGYDRLHQHRDVRITIAQCDIRLMHWLKSNFGGYCGIHNKAQGNRRACWNWNIGGPRCEEILRRIRLYSITKIEQIDIGLAYRATMGWHSRPKGVRGAPITEEVRRQRQDLIDQLHSIKGAGAHRVKKPAIPVEQIQ